MTDSFLETLLPQLASGAAHTHALGFAFEGLDGDRVRIRVPYRDDLIGDPETGRPAPGRRPPPPCPPRLLDHVGGLAVWVGLGTFRPVATLDLRVDYMRAAAPGRDLLAEARCYRLTRNLAFVRAWAFEDDPTDPVAAAQSAYMVSAEGDHRPGANLKSRTVA